MGGPRLVSVSVVVVVVVRRVLERKIQLAMGWINQHTEEQETETLRKIQSTHKRPPLRPSLRRCKPSDEKRYLHLNSPHKRTELASILTLLAEQNPPTDFFLLLVICTFNSDYER